MSLLIGRRLRFHQAPGIIIGIERISDPTGKLFGFPEGEARLFNVLESMGVQTEKMIGAPLMNPYGQSLDMITCFGDHFRVDGDTADKLVR